VLTEVVRKQKEKTFLILSPNEREAILWYFKRFVVSLAFVKTNIIVKQLRDEAS
jgi:hypothetical protein